MIKRLKKTPNEDSSVNSEETNKKNKLDNLNKHNDIHNKSSNYNTESIVLPKENKSISRNKSPRKSRQNSPQKSNDSSPNKSNKRDSNLDDSKLVKSKDDKSDRGKLQRQEVHITQDDIIVNTKRKNGTASVSETDTKKSKKSKYGVDDVKFGNFLKLNYYLENKNIKHVDREFKEEEKEDEEEELNDKLMQQIKNLDKKPLKPSTILFYNNTMFMMRNDNRLKRKNKKKSFAFQPHNLQVDKNTLLNDGNEQLVNMTNTLYDVDER